MTWKSVTRVRDAFPVQDWASASRFGVLSFVFERLANQEIAVSELG